jgi:hypothetical protein
VADTPKTKFDVEAIQSSHPFPSDPFPEWDRYRVVDSHSKSLREEYVDARIQELEDSGVSLLFVCFSALGLSEQVDECLASLKRLGKTQFFVRLIDRNEKPPPTDPSGLPFPEAKEGALSAKVGTKYTDEGATKSRGRARSIELRAGRPITINVVIGKKAKSVSLEQARVIWNQWGYRAQENEFVFNGARCNWLVAECDSAGNTLS